MALLTITAVTPSSAASGVVIKAELTDERGAPVTGFNADEDVYVLPNVATTSALGSVSIDLTPNSEITPAGTYYTIWIGSKSFRIQKSADTQSLYEALV